MPERERRHMPVADWRVWLMPGTEVEIETAGRFLRAVVTANDGMGRASCAAGFVWPRYGSDGGPAGEGKAD